MAKFYTDGSSIFKLVPPETAVLINLETQKHTKVIIDPDGELHGLRRVVINQADAAEKTFLPEPSPVAKRQYKKRAVAGDPAGITTSVRAGKSSKYYGVGFNKKTGKYKTGFWVEVGGVKKNIAAGSNHQTEEAAARAVDDKLQSLGLPRRNFPQATA